MKNNDLPPDMRERLDQFLEALEKGEVSIPVIPSVDTNPEDILAKDGDATLILRRDSMLESGFMLTIIDGGGFTGICVSVDDWARMRDIIDRHVASLTAAPDTPIT